MTTKYLNLFIKCLDEKRFYDAHESIEILWFPKRFNDCNETKLLKGFINAAVSFELEKRGKEDSSKKVWKNYLKYRPLLYKIDSIHLNHYHYVSRYIEKIKYNNPKLYKNSIDGTSQNSNTPFSSVKF